MADPSQIEGILRSDPSDAPTKTAAWKAWYGSSEPKALYSALKGLPLSGATKDSLWKAKFPDPAAATAAVSGSGPSVARSAAQPKEGPIDSAIHDVKIGFKSGAAELEHLGANTLNLVGAKDSGAALEKKSKELAPSQEELANRDGVMNTIMQGVGSLPTSLVRYAPAMLAGRYKKILEPIVAGATDVIGASDKGAAEALKEGASTATGFYLQNLAGGLKTRKGRILAGAGAMAAPTLLASGGDAKKTLASAVLGGAMGAVGKGHGQENTLTEAVKSAKEVTDSFTKDIKGALAPTTLSPEAARTGRIARAALGGAALKMERAEYALRGLRDSFDTKKIDKSVGMSQEGIDFYDAFETGKVNTLKDPVERAGAKTLKDAFDDRYQKLNAAGLLDAYVENYLPRSYAKPEAAGKAFAEMSRRQMEGTKGFQRQRKWATLKEGIDYMRSNPASELRLADANPVDAALRKIADMDKILAAKQIMGEMKSEGILRLVRDGKEVGTGKKLGPGYSKIDDKVATVQFRRDGMKTIIGEYYAPSDAARVINNHLSPSPMGNPWIAGMARGANGLNQFQLAASAFHLGMTGINATVSHAALGIEKIGWGLQTKNLKLIGSGAKDWLRSPLIAIEPITDKMFGQSRKSIGSAVWDEWHGEGSNPQMAAMVDYAKEAGARLQTNPFFRTQMYRKMKIALANGSKIGAASRAIPALMEKSMQPIMEQYVPRQKLAMFSRMMEFEVSKLPATATQDDVRRVAQKAWNSVDNRMGQLVYDNLFWDQTAKALMHLAIRSVGWNWGTFMEIGGGARDFTTINKRLKAGDAAVTSRMAYVVALPVITGMMNAMTTYLMTGQAPHGMDYIAARTGGNDGRGRPNRLFYPSYMSDVAKGYLDVKRQGPVSGTANFVKSKLNPGLTLAYDMMTNSDWANNKISDPNDTATKRLFDNMAYVARDFVPISGQAVTQNFQEDHLKGLKKDSVASILLPKIGIVTASSVFTKTEAEAYLDTMADDGGKRASRTQDQVKNSSHQRDIEVAFRSGMTEDKIREALKDKIDKGEITEQMIASAQKNSARSPLANRMERQTDFNTALKAYDLALYDTDIPPEEIDEIREIMQKKVGRELAKHANTPDGDPKKRRLMAKLHELGLDADE